MDISKISGLELKNYESKSSALNSKSIASAPVSSGNQISFMGRYTTEQQKQIKQEQLASFKKALGDNVEIKNVEDAKRILDGLGFKNVKINENGLLEINKYCQPSPYVTFKELGIVEDSILSYIQIVRNSFDFTNSRATSFGSVEEVGGNIKNIPSVVEAGALKRVKDPQQLNRCCAEKLFHDGLKQTIGSSIKLENNIDRKAVFDALGINYELDKDGQFILENFQFPKTHLLDAAHIGKSYSGYNYDYIDLEKLLATTKEIKGDCVIAQTDGLSLSNLKKIGGKLSLFDVENIAMENLEDVSGFDVYKVTGARFPSLSGVDTIDIAQSSSVYLNRLSQVRQGGKIASATYYVPDASVLDNNQIAKYSSRLLLPDLPEDYVQVNAIKQSQKAFPIEENPEALIKKYKSANPNADILQQIADDMYAFYRKTGKYAVEYPVEYTKEDAEKMAKIVFKPFRLIFNANASRTLSRLGVDISDSTSYWSYRTPTRHDIGSIVERICLNVKPDAELVHQLDALMGLGKIKNENDEIVKLKNYAKFYYKVPLEIEEWGSRQDPVTLYFDEKVNDETLEVIRRITAPFARGVLNESDVAKNTNWMLIEDQVSEKMIQNMIDEAKTIGTATEEFINQNSPYLTSNGLFQTCNAILKELKILKSVI